MKIHNNYNTNNSNSGVVPQQTQQEKPQIFVLKIDIEDKRKVTTLRVTTNLTIDSCIEEIWDKEGEKHKDHGLFFPGDAKKKPMWLDPERKLSFYGLHDRETLIYKRKHRPFRYKFIDGTQKTLLIDDSSIVSDIVLAVAKHISLKEEAAVEFGLRRENDKRSWLLGTHTLYEEDVVRTDILCFARQVFGHSLDQSDPLILELTYIQSKDSILSEEYHCTRKDAIDFAALQIQITFGDHDPTKHKAGFLNLEHFLPLQWRKKRGIETDILTAHKILYGTSWALAKYKYSSLFISNFTILKQPPPIKRPQEPPPLKPTQRTVVKIESPPQPKQELVMNWFIERSFPADYAQLFINCGYDSLDILCLVEDSDLKEDWAKTILPGHRKKFVNEITKFREDKERKELSDPISVTNLGPPKRFSKALPVTPIPKTIPKSSPEPVTPVPNTIPEGESTALQFRQNLSPNEPILPLGSIEIKNFVPKKNCSGEVEELQNLPDMDQLHLILQECNEYTDAAKWKDNPNSLNDNEILSVALYTHDLLGKSPREKNFYFQLNNMLRKRSPDLYDKWRGYLYYLQSALSKFPDLETTVYRGIPAENFDLIQKEYKEKRPIFWSAFSSSTPDLKVAQSFAKENGIIMKVKVYYGKIIKEYSMLKGEDEVLMKPNSKFIVSKGIYKNMDGYYYIELEEQLKEFIF